MTPKPHELLASAIATRRGELGLSLREVAELAGITGETLRAVRKGANEPSELTKRGLERALQWTAGSVDRILVGGEPNVVHQASAHLRAESRMEARLDPPTKAAVEAFLSRPVPTDEELRASALQPSTVDALIAMRERFARWAAEGNEDQIRRAGRLTEALDEDRDAG